MRISSLDGLRAVAAALVVAAHLVRQWRFPGWEILGPLGVYLFFVLSGYLITTLLAREEQKDGEISLRRFWLRRALRILPAYLTYVAAMLVLDRFSPAIDLSPASIVAAFTFTTGWRYGDWELGHLWTLAVEMQFYLFWPLVMCGCNARWRARVAGGLIAVGIVGRILVYRWLGPDRMLASICNLDGIVLGCLLGLWLAAGPAPVRQTWGKVRRVALPATLALAAAVIALLLAGKGAAFTVPLGNTSIALALAALVLEILLSDGGVVYRVLNSSSLVWLGSLSYSIYLWQQVVLRPGGLAPVLGAEWLNRGLVRLALILGLAMASYYGLERPFVGLRQRLHQPRAARPARPSV